MLGKTEGSGRGSGGCDGWMASPTQWTWTWVSLGDGEGWEAWHAAVYGVAKSGT